MAGTVVDALLISLNIEASKVSSGAAKVQADLKRVGTAGDTVAKDLDHAAKMMVGSLNRVRTEVLSLFAVFTAGRGLKSMVEDIVGGDAATGRLARSVGMATGELGALQEAAKRVGGTAEGVGSSIAGLSAKFTEFRETGQGGESWIPALQRMGVALVDDTGKMKSFTALFLDMAGWSERKTPQQSGYFLSQLGLDPGTIRLIQQGRAGVQRSLAEARSLGVASDADAKASAELLANLTKMRQVADDLVRVVVREFAGPLNASMADLSRWLAANGPRLRTEIADRITWIVSEVRGFITAADAAAASVGGWVHVSEALFALWAGSKVLGLIGGMLRVGSALGLLGRGGGAAVAGAAGTGLGALGMAAGATLGAGAAAGAMQVPMVDDQGRVIGNWGGKDEGKNPAAAPGMAATGSRRDQDDFIERLAHAIGRFMGRDTPVLDTADPGSGMTPAESNGKGRGQGSLGVGAPTPDSATQQARAKQAFDYFVSKGHSPYEAAGLAARIKLESGFNPGAVPTTGENAYGIMQWHPDRRANLAGAGKGVIGATFEQQLDAIEWELNNTEAAAGRAIKGVRSAAEGGRFVSRLLIRPGKEEADKAREAERTAAQAEAYYKMFTGPGRTPGGSNPVSLPPGTLPAQRISALRWGGGTTNNATDNSSSSTVANHVGQVVIHTAARDGREVAGTIKRFLADTSYSDSRRGLA